MENIFELTGAICPTGEYLFELIKENSVSEIRSILKENDDLLESRTEYFGIQTSSGWHYRSAGTYDGEDSLEHQRHTLLSYR